MAGKFVISKRSNGDFQFNLKAGNGQVILASQGYADKAGCKNGIESVKKNSPEDGRYERKTSSNDRPFFNPCWPATGRSSATARCTKASPRARTASHR